MPSTAVSAADRVGLLVEAGRILAAPLDAEEALTKFALVLVPTFADLCSIDFYAGNGARRLVVADSDGQAKPIVVGFETIAPDGDTQTPEHRAIESEVLVIPVTTLDGVVATLTLTMAKSGRRYTQGDLDLAEELGRRCATALESGALYKAATEAARERRESVGLLDSILAESPIGFAFFDRDLRIQRINHTLADIHEVPVEDHIGRTLREVVPGLSDTIHPVMERIIQGEATTTEIELSGYTSNRPDALTRWTAHYYPVRDTEGLVIGVGAIVIDVTDRREADDARVRSESQLRLALEAAHMGLWHWNLKDPQDLRWSQSTALLLGVDPLERPTPELLYASMHEDDVKRLQGSIRRSVTEGLPYEEEFRVVWADGSVHWLLCKGQVQTDRDGPSEMIGVAIDVTEQRAVHDESERLALRQARAGEQAVRMQRVTSALSEAMTVSQVCDVILVEGCSVVGAPRGAVALLSEETDIIEIVRTVGYSQNGPDIWQDISLDTGIPTTEAIRTGRPILCCDEDEIQRTFPSVDAIRASGTKAVALFPLEARGKNYGAWSVAWTESRAFEEGELIILLTLASQAGQAMERARIYERERFISTALQRTLLPQRLPSLPGATTARRYRPSNPEVEVGGDWYDVIGLPSNRVGLVVGDVGGHNIDAAAVMGQLRNAVRSYAWEGHPPGDVMQATNRLLCGLEPGVLATCCYVELNLDDGIASVALAGHPPPLVVTDVGSAAFMEMAADPPLGTDAAGKYDQGTLFLSPMDSLLMYTDGLVESRSVGLSQGMLRLAGAAGGGYQLSPEEFADHILREVVPGHNEDDVALLVLRYESVVENATGTGQRRVKRHLPASPSSAGVARRFSADVLSDWGADDLVEQVGLCVSELVTNALIHTTADMDLVLWLSPSSVRVEVFDHSDHMPVMRTAGGEDTSGRGLHIVDVVATTWGIESAGSGKAVWFELAR